MEAQYTNKMTSKELDEFRRTWADKLFGNNTELYLSKHIRLVRERKFFNYEKQIVHVYGNNHIELGILTPQNGCVTGTDLYYPIIVFYNQLNYTLIGGGGYNDAQPNNTRFHSYDDEFVISTEKLLDGIRESFVYVKIFED